MPKFILFCLLFLLVGCGGNDELTLPAGNPTSGITFTSTRDGNEEIYLIQPDGTGLTRLTEHESVDTDATWSPDGTMVAFRSRRDGSSDIFVMAGDGSGVVNLLGDPAGSFDDEFVPKWHPDGDQLALYTDRPPFQGCTGHMPATMTLTGGVDSITKSGTSGETFTWTPDGQQLLIGSVCFGAGTQFRLWDIPTGQIRGFPATNDIASEGFPAYSHNGQFLAFQGVMEGNSEILILDLATNTLSNITNHPDKDTQPTWSPDDSQIAFVTNRDGNDEIYIMNADGSDTRNLTNHPATDTRPGWSPIP